VIGGQFNAQRFAERVFNAGPVYADAVSGTITLAGTLAESASRADAPQGAVSLTGSCSESHASTSTPAGSIPAAGVCTSSHAFTDSPAGSIAVSGTISESWGIVYSDAHTRSSTLAGTVSVTGSLAESYTRTGAPSDLFSARYLHPELPDEPRVSTAAELRSAALGRASLKS
jgi:hypothetical protein